MTHARTQIRQAVVTLLDGQTLAGSHVYGSRVHPLDEAKLPALLVYAREEEIQQATISYPRQLQRELLLVVEAYAQAKAGLEDALDTLARDIEQIMAADPSLGGLVKDSLLSSTAMQLSGDGDKPVGVATLNYRVAYVTSETEPEILA